MAFLSCKTSDLYINCKVNYTLSIDMSNSWDASNVPWNSINKSGSYPMNNQILWPSKDGKTCYGFGGESSMLWVLNNLNPTYSPRPVDLYVFTLNTQLSGNWTTFNAPSYRSAQSSAIFQPLNRPSHALGAMVDNTGFIVGGVVDSWSQSGLGNINEPIPCVSPDPFSPYLRKHIVEHRSLYFVLEFEKPSRS